MTKSKSITGLSEFTANGNKYYLADTISPRRYKEYEKLSPMLSHGLTWQNVYANLMQAYNALNKPMPEPVAAGTIIHNIMNGIRDIDNENRLHPALMMCALVINREGEDESVYDKQLMAAKIEDWEKEGLDMKSFFGIALNSIHGFKEILIKSIQEKIPALENELQNIPK